MIAILNYGLGNIGSIVSILNLLNLKFVVSSDPKVLSRADRLVLPGVGSFDSAMARLTSPPYLADSVRNHAQIEKKPTLGICLGAQLLLEASEEGSCSGLGLIHGRSMRIKAASELRIPHIGWAEVSPARDSALLGKRGSQHSFYFVHSFAPYPTNPDHVLATADYGEPFPAVVGDENIYGVQFHPEKSHKFGQAIFKNFAKL